MTIKCKKCGTEYLPPAPHECDWGCGKLLWSITIMALSLLSSVCMGREIVRNDGPHTRLEVTINIIPSYESMDKACSSMLGGIYINMAGCARWEDANGKRYLTMWIKEPKNTDDRRAFCAIGHELWHGVYGEFHKEPAGC